MSAPDMAQLSAASSKQVLISPCGLLGVLETSMNVGLNIGLQSEFKSHVLRPELTHAAPVLFKRCHGVLLYLKRDCQIQEEANVSHNTNSVFKYLYFPFRAL